MFTLWSPLPGTQYHCVRCCLKQNIPHTWESRTDGVPIKCSHCNSDYCFRIPRRLSNVLVTKDDFITHNCYKCMQLWNGTMKQDRIDQAIMRSAKRKWDNMLYQVYEGMRADYVAACIQARKEKRGTPKLGFKNPCEDPRPIERKLTKYMLAHDLRFFKGDLTKLADIPIRSL